MMKLMLAFTLALSTLTACGDTNVKPVDLSPIEAAIKATAKTSADSNADAIKAIGAANEKTLEAQAAKAEAEKALAVAEAEQAAQIAEAAKHTDGDNDGIVDAVDKCPKEAEDKDGFEDDDGCPDTDNDKDGILDADDLCPMGAGVKEQGGCTDPAAKAQAEADKAKTVVETVPAPEKCARKVKATKVKTPCEIKVKTPAAPPTAESVLAELRWYAQKTDKRLDSLEADADKWRSDHERLDSLGKEVIAGRTPKKTFDLGVANSK